MYGVVEKLDSLFFFLSHTTEILGHKMNLISSRYKTDPKSAILHITILMELVVQDVMIVADLDILKGD